MADEIWAAGAYLYGNQWERENGSQPGGDWLAMLRSVNACDFRKALNNMRLEFESMVKANDTPWPPTAEKFRILGNKTSSLYFPKNMPPDYERPALEHKNKYSDLTPEESLAEIRRLTRGNNEMPKHDAEALRANDEIHAGGSPERTGEVLGTASELERESERDDIVHGG